MADAAEPQAQTTSQKFGEMASLAFFPFGRPVRPVVQTDRTPKRVFVLGV